MGLARSVIALLAFAWAFAALAIREEALPSLDPESPDADADRSQRKPLLPRSCGEDGVISLQAGMTYRTDTSNHSIQAGCHTLRGAPGAQILLSTGVFFMNASKAVVQGPLSITMAPRMDSISAAAFQSPGELRLLSPDGGLVEFKHIKTSVFGAALFAQHSILIEGQGSVVFENLHSKRGAAAQSHQADVIITAANVTFYKISSVWGGGAVWARRGVYLKGSGSTLFDNCTSAWGGGAIFTLGTLTLSGSGKYVFNRCISNGDVSGGGALAASDGIVVELSERGSVVFIGCQALGRDSGGGGGAPFSSGDIHVAYGTIEFQDCLAGCFRGHAINAAHGIVNISGTAQVQFAGMRANTGVMIFARIAILPASGDVLPEDVFASEALLALKPPSQNDSSCPAGSRFYLDSYGLPIQSKCIMCGDGTASLAPSFMEEIAGEAVPQAGMQIVLVRRTSPNALRPFPLQPSNISHYDVREPCEDKRGCALGIGFGQWDQTWDCSPLTLEHRSTLAFNFEHGVIRTADGWVLAIPFNDYVTNAPAAVIQGLRSVYWSSENDTGMFVVVENGAVSPVNAPGLVLGVGHDVAYRYEPTNPYDACLPCHQVAPEAPDKIRCHGGTHVSSLPGFMILHIKGSRTLFVHSCPNADACPGSNVSLTAEGDLAPGSQICAEGYAANPGCVRCAPGYGRPHLEPFTCRACGTMSVLQQVGIAALSSGTFYAFALHTARPRTNTQQIFKLFLAFFTISCRSLSAMRHTLHYQRLKSDLYFFFAVDWIDAVEPGVGVSSFDCWGLATGPLEVKRRVMLEWAIPLGLMLISSCWLGACRWLKVLVVWGNLFVPALFGAAASLIPCISTQEEGRVFSCTMLLTAPRVPPASLKAWGFPASGSPLGHRPFCFCWGQCYGSIWLFVTMRSSQTPLRIW